jgi:hypothetical protein
MLSLDRDHEKATREAVRKAREVRREIASQDDVKRLEQRLERVIGERRSFGEPS